MTQPPINPIQLHRSFIQREGEREREGGKERETETKTETDRHRETGRGRQSEIGNCFPEKNTVAFQEESQQR